MQIRNAVDKIKNSFRFCLYSPALSAVSGNAIQRESCAVGAVVEQVRRENR
jgi:hypothetical protein